MTEVALGGIQLRVCDDVFFNNGIIFPACPLFNPLFNQGIDFLLVFVRVLVGKDVHVLVFVYQAPRP